MLWRAAKNLQNVVNRTQFRRRLAPVTHFGALHPAKLRTRLNRIENR
jgi:hypothetical protein